MHHTGAIGDRSTTKTPLEIKKDREAKLRRRMKNDSEFRKKKGQELKKAYWERKDESIRARQARPRSFQIWVGGKKEVSKREKRHRAGRKKVPYV